MCSSGVWISAIAFASIDAGDAALVEDVRVGAAARERVGRREAAALERLGGERDGGLVLAEAVAAVRAVDLRLHLALLERGREGERLLHLAHDVGELRLVVARAPRPSACSARE